MIERPTMKPYTMRANQSFTEQLHISPRLDAAHIFPTPIGIGVPDQTTRTLEPEPCLEKQ
jgi:hypothetical protein